MESAARRLSLGDAPAILVVDFMNAFTNPRFPLGADLDHEVESTKFLLDEARARDDLPIIFTVEAFSPTLVDAAVWSTKIPSVSMLVEGSPWVQLDDRMERRPGEVVLTKKGPSAFCGTHLASLLISLRVDTVILCGATTSGCIRATAIDLMQYGFPAFVPIECVGDRATAPHQANLFDIDAQYGDVVSLEKMIAYVRGLSPRLRVLPDAPAVEI